MAAWHSGVTRASVITMGRPGVHRPDAGLDRRRSGEDVPNMAELMHEDEWPIDDAMVRQLLLEQFPDWAGLPLQRVETAGTVNAIFRLGDNLSVRLPRHRGPTRPGGKEWVWLSQLAPWLPLAIPIPLAQGLPNSDYPWFWQIHRWMAGMVSPVTAIDPIQAARDLADFVAALQRVNLPDGPLGRGIPLAERDEDFQYWLKRFDGDPAVSRVWEQALAAPPWPGPPIWHHGDLDCRNWLWCDGRISSIIDWDEMGIGDPACDVMVAWKLHSAGARDAFRAALPTDDATWARARGWVVSQAVAILAYYTVDNNPLLCQAAREWLELVLSEPDD